jgi:uncharacterized protein YcfJ
MNKTMVTVVCVSVLVSAAGCQSSPNRAGEGALIGGLIGAGTGAIIGHQSGERDKGALIGGVTGALAGTLVGSQVQKQPAAGQQAAAAQGQSSNPNQMSVPQIIDMTRQGVHEDVIVDRIRLSNSRFVLSAEDVAYLQQNGVSQKVIAAMQGY